MAIVVAAVGCQPAATPTPTGTANGLVTAGPTCPVEQAGHPCPPRPVAATINAVATDGHTAASARTDSSGGFTLSLAPGSYSLTVNTGSAFPRCPTTPVQIQPAKVTTANISCDTGIR